MIDFTFSEQQTAAADLAVAVYTDHAEPEQIRAAEGAAEALNRPLWNALASSGLLGIWIGEDAGGAGCGILELCAALQVQGRYVVHAPVLPSAVGGMFIDRFAPAALREQLLPGVVDGTVIIAPALGELGPYLPTAPQATVSVTGDGAEVTGQKISVPCGEAATHFLVPVRRDDGTVLVGLLAREAPHVTVTPVRTTDRDHAAHVDMVGAPMVLIGDASSVEWLYQHCVVAACAVQLGVLEAATKAAAEYTSTRTQFGRPLTYFQTVLKRGADAYIDTRAVRVTMWYAAWQLANDMDGAEAAAIAKWWASEAGHRTAHSTLYLHGGLGNDLTYPVHRYYLWAKQNDAALGGPTQQLERIGEGLAI
ncbi:acyl-CoA/acyl-ACP dehydrogenase [Nocardia vinacea]|uniref:Acyl-CoA/acyl-ACP dehydrogenase n=1 Tax=Nocardia vinacea TaxID=96468 RepID=A0ABZ1YWQ5_9NOCA|nr:acyl-CoA dehydrogenase family protein [Nocardia vinacea]